MAAFVLSMPGCGGPSEAKVSDSGQYLIDARQAIADGNTPKALEALSASIESEPNIWAYMERAKINAKQGGADQTVLDDCKEILKLHPENRDVPWLQGELKKPVEQRFKGRFAIPPSYTK
ncbi:MAG: hypothetical protein H0T51_13800 [Pirellulales bacterium]|nr:hypothetical protein [Pirellulales bacterium]